MTLGRNQPTLTVIVHSAQKLEDVESFGKNDPYCQFTLNLTDPRAFQKTQVQKNSGKSANWNETFNMSYNNESELFVEVLDDEKVTDAIIGFTAIPLNQVFNSPGGKMNGLFELFSPSGKHAGELNMTIICHSVAGSDNHGQSAQMQSQPMKGRSYMNELHQKRAKSMKSKEQATDAAGAAAAGIFAVGAGFLANKLMGDKEDRKDWHPVTTYKTGDKVEYEGKKYVCVQDHTSSDNQKPSMSLSLWSS